MYYDTIYIRKINHEKAAFVLTSKFDQSYESCIQRKYILDTNISVAGFSFC